MALSDAEIIEIRRWLGYTGLTESARPYFDIATVFERIVRETIDPGQETYVRDTVLPALRRIDVQIDESNCRLAASEVDEIKIRPDEFEALRKRQRFWVDRLSEVVGVAAWDRRQEFGPPGHGHGEVY